MTRLKFFIVTFVVLSTFCGVIHGQNDSHVTNPTGSQNTEIHDSRDGRWLYYQITLQLTLFDQSTIVLVTRPGEGIFFSERIGDDMVRKFALAVGVDGTVETVRRSEKSELSFHILPICLNPKQVERPTSLNDCLPRPISDRGQDFVQVIGSKITDKLSLVDGRDKLALTPPEEQLTGWYVDIFDFRKSGYKSFQEFNPYAKCCLDHGKYTVCAWAVRSSSGAVCGFSISDLDFLRNMGF